MDKIKEKKWIQLGLIPVFIIFSIIAAFTENPAGGADNYAHFNISRWAFRYPHLFLDHWGKPIFTMLTAPFAQLGFIGVRVFNVMCGLATAWLSYKLLRKFKIENAWFVIFSVIFTPIYFVILFSGMTEILFSLVLLISIYLFFKKEYLFSSLFISFIFLVRTEGLIFLPLFLIAYLFKKQYKVIPFLLTGFLLFSFIGWVYYYHDFWWLINSRPYALGGPSVYGSGDWFHFFVKMPHYFGLVVSVLLILGTLALFVKWMNEKCSFKSEKFFQILLILGCFWGYFFAHTYLWWRTENSAGLVRVMAGVSPLAALIGVFSFDTFKKIKIPKYIYSVFIGFLVLVLVWYGVKFYRHAVRTDLTHEVLKRTTTWLKDSESLEHKLVLHDPYFAYSTGVDAWDYKVVQYGFSNNDFAENGLPDSTIFIWDSHFSANEGRCPLNKLLDNPNFEPIKYFEPILPFGEADENGYKIVVFRKIGNTGSNDRKTLETLKQEEFGENVIFSQIYRFEEPFADVNMETKRQQQTDDSLNIVYSLANVEFSPAFVIDETNIKEMNGLKIKLSADFNCKEEFDEKCFLMVFSVEKDNQSYHYETRDIYAKIGKTEFWSNQVFTFNVPNEIKQGTELKAYIWNINKNNALLDNLKIEIAKQVK